MIKFFTIVSITSMIACASVADAKNRHHRPAINGGYHVTEAGSGQSPLVRRDRAVPAVPLSLPYPNGDWRKISKEQGKEWIEEWNKHEEQLQIERGKNKEWLKGGERRQLERELNTHFNLNPNRFDEVFGALGWEARGKQ